MKQTKKTTPAPKPTRKLARGFAVMDPTRVHEIATLGGEAVSRNRKHMKKIGAIGGRAPHKAKG